MLRKVLCASLLAVIVPIAGCSFIADFDRSKIKHEPADSGLGTDAGATPGKDAAVSDAAVSDAAIRDAAIGDAGKDAAISDDDAGQVEDAGPECTSPSQCPGADGPCSTRTCTLGVCGVHDLGAGSAALSGQTDGDCHEQRCNANGATTNEVDDTDLPDDEKECTTDSCVGGVVTNTNIGAGMTCPVTTTGKCSSTGNCVVCVTASTCPGTDSDCRVRTCSPEGACGFEDTLSGTVTADPPQAANDCREIQCDGDGKTKTVAKLTDVPVDDGNDCTSESCNGTMEQHPARALNFDCNDNNGKFCDGNKNCVKCNMGSQCTSMICLAQECATASVLTSVAAVPASLGIGAKGNVTFSFTLRNAWPSNGALSLVFPAGFDISGASFVSMNGATGGASPTIGGQEITLDRTSGTFTTAGSMLTVVVAGVENPDAAGATGSFSVVTRTNEGIAIDTGTAAAVTIASGALAAISGTPASLVAGATGNFTLAFTTASSWPANGKLSVTFPGGFSNYNVAGAGFVSMTGAAGSATVSVAGSVVTLTRTGGSAQGAGAISVVLSGIKNPGLTGTTGSIALATQNNAGVAIDSGTAVGVTLTPGAMSALSATPASLVAGASGNLTLGFTTANTWSSTGKLVITFPAGFDVSNAGPSALFTFGADSTAAVAISGQVLTLTRSGGSFTTAGAITVVLNGIKNPGVTGTTGTFGLVTQNAAGVTVDTGTANGVTITAGALTAVSAELETTLPGETGNLTLKLTTTNPWPANGKLLVAFPSQLDITDADIASIDAGTANADVNGQLLTLTRSSGTVVAAGTAVTIVLSGIENSDSVGTTDSFTVITNTNTNTPIDSGSAAGVSIATGTLTAASVDLGQYVIDELVTVDITFTTANELPADGTISVLFPAELSNIANLSTIGLSTDGSYLPNVVVGQLVTFIRDGNGTALPAGTPIVIELSNVKTPLTAGTTGSYTITTKTSAGVAIDSTTIAGSVITL